MFPVQAFRSGARFMLAAITIATVMLAARAADAACLGVARSITVKSFNGNLGASPSGGIGLRDKEVVLTFDDGPKAGTTPAILRALRAECTKATFFMVGSMAKANPGIARQVRAAGHTVAHHTQGHGNLAQKSDAAVRSEISRGVRSVNAAVGGRSSNLFRYPYLARSQRTDRVVRSLGLLPLSAAVMSLDWKSGDMVGRVMSRLNARGRGVILLHDIQGRTAKHLPDLLRRLRQNGYKVVHLRGRGYKPSREPVVASVEKNTKKTVAKAEKAFGSRVSVKSIAKAGAAKPQRKGFFARLREKRAERAVAIAAARAARKDKRVAALKVTAPSQRKSFFQVLRDRREARIAAARDAGKSSGKAGKARPARVGIFAQWRARRAARLAKWEASRRSKGSINALELATLAQDMDDPLAARTIAAITTTNEPAAALKAHWPDMEANEMSETLAALQDLLAIE